MEIWFPYQQACSEQATARVRVSIWPMARTVALLLFFRHLLSVWTVWTTQGSEPETVRGSGATTYPGNRREFREVRRGKTGRTRALRRAGEKFICGGGGGGGSLERPKIGGGGLWSGKGAPVPEQY